MSNYAADDFQAIERRRQEIKAEREQALTGSSAPVTGQGLTDNDPSVPSGYGPGSTCGYVHPMNTAIQSQWLGYDPA